MQTADQGSLRCPVCRTESPEEIFRSSNDYPIVRCQSCRLVFTDDRKAPPPETLYPSFDQTESAAMEGMRSALSVFLRQRSGFVRKLKPTGRVLDYGCGNGAFASFMAQQGYESVGLEPFSLGKTFQSDRLKLIRAPLKQAEAELGQFDVITMWHVLEHLSDPVDVLETLAKHLKPDGLLVVSVPNLQSWQGEVFRGGWFHLDPPRHLLHFEPETLRATLERAGFAEEAQKPFLPEYGSSGWIQSALNKVLPHKNFLYELVKDRGALKSMSPVSSAVHLGASVLGGAPLFALSLPVELAASALNKSAALTVAARKIR